MNKKVHELPDVATIDFDAETGLFVFSNPTTGKLYKMTADAIGFITTSDIEFRVGDVGFPQDGDATMTLASNINKVRVIRNSIPQSTINDGGYYQSFNQTTKLLTFHPNLSSNELIQIQPY